jgi:hypothetical protein
VVVVATCEALLATTFAPAIGAPLSMDRTVPLSPPVVPASAHVSWLSTATSRIATVTIRRAMDFIIGISLEKRMRVKKRYALA